MGKKNVWLLIATILVCLVTFKVSIPAIIERASIRFSAADPYSGQQDANIMDQFTHCVIEHAMGGIGEDEYTNSREAFLENYEKGHRFFEVDFSTTNDGHVVLWHDWYQNPVNSSKKAPTYDEFMSMRINGKYTPLAIEDLLSLMKTYTDVYIVTDFKILKEEKVKKQFEEIVNTAMMMGADRCLDRMIIQLYDKSTKETVESVWRFQHYILTLYQMFEKAPTVNEFTELAKYCVEDGIEMITMKAGWWNPDFRPIAEKYGLLTAVHTVNKEKSAAKFYDQGVNAIYTDFLPPQ